MNVYTELYQIFTLRTHVIKDIWSTLLAHRSRYYISNNRDHRSESKIDNYTKIMQKKIMR